MTPRTRSHSQDHAQQSCKPIAMSTGTCSLHTAAPWAQTGGHTLGWAPACIQDAPLGIFKTCTNIQVESMDSVSTAAQSQHGAPLQGLVLNLWPGSMVCQERGRSLQSSSLRLASFRCDFLCPPYPPVEDNSFTGERAAELDCSMKGAV